MVFAVNGGSQQAISTEEFYANYNALKSTEQIRPYFEWFSNHMDVLELWHSEVVAMNEDGEVFVYGAPDGYEIRLGYCGDAFTFLGITRCLVKVGTFPIENHPDIYWRFTAMRVADVLDWLRANRKPQAHGNCLAEQLHDFIKNTRQGYMDATINIYPDSQLKHVYDVTLWIPAGAEWVACNADGAVYAYSNKPRVIKAAGVWLPTAQTESHMWKVGQVSENYARVCSAWQDSLRKVSIHDNCGTDVLIAEDAGPAYRKMNVHKEQLFAEADGRWVMRYGLWLWVPKWTTHVAVDKDGWIYAYDSKPEIGAIEDKQWDNGGDCPRVGVMLESSAASFWKTSLRTVNLIMSDTDEKATEQVEEPVEAPVEEPLKGKVRHIPIIETDYFGETIRFPERRNMKASVFEYIAMNKSGQIWAYERKPEQIINGCFCNGGTMINVGEVTDKALAERMWQDSLREIKGAV